MRTFNRPNSRRPPADRVDKTSATTTSTDAALLERLRSGDEKAFESWVRTETPRLLGATRRILRNDEDARDAVQEAFLQAFRALDEFAGEARLSTWLHRIAINAALMQLRRRRGREEPIEALLPRFTEDGRRTTAGPIWPAIEENDFDRGELRQVLQECYDRLPSQQRLILLLRDLEGLDTSETASMLGIGKDAVKMRLHRARQALRALLEPYVLEGLWPSEVETLERGPSGLSSRRPASGIENRPYEIFRNREARVSGEESASLQSQGLSIPVQIRETGWTKGQVGVESL